MCIEMGMNMGIIIKQGVIVLYPHVKIDERQGGKANE